MTKYRFTPKASREFYKLDSGIQKRILVKLDYYCSNSTLFWFSRHLSNKDLGEYRLRIGNYRVMYDVDEEGIRIIRVGHRRDIYK